MWGPLIWATVYPTATELQRFFVWHLVWQMPATEK